MAWRLAFANCKVEDLHQVMGKLNQTGYHSILLVAQGFVLTQSIHVNSARGILKGKRNSTSFDCLGNQRT